MNKQIVPGKPFIAKKKIQCRECNEVLFSKYQGHFNRCKCEEYIFIDETNHYCRIGGKSEKIIFLEDTITPEDSRLLEMDELLSTKMNNRYPEVQFKLKSLDPITLLHDSLELSLDDELVKVFIDLATMYCSEKECLRIIVEYDILEEMDTV